MQTEELESTQQVHLDAPPEESAPLSEEKPPPRKRNRSVKNKDPSDLEPVEVKIMSNGKEKTFTARRVRSKSVAPQKSEPPPREPSPARGRYYAFHHKTPSARQNAFDAILASW